jgi:hypothetical protein
MRQEGQEGQEGAVVAGRAGRRAGATRGVLGQPTRYRLRAHWSGAGGASPRGWGCWRTATHTAGSSARTPQRSSCSQDRLSPHLVSGRPLSHNGEDPALWACRRGAAVAVPHRRTSPGRRVHSLAAARSQLAQATAAGRQCQPPRGRPSYACEQEVSRGRQDAEEAAETQAAEAAEEARRVEDTRSSVRLRVGPGPCEWCPARPWLYPWPPLLRMERRAVQISRRACGTGSGRPRSCRAQI